jgi:hypothetical protein
MSWKTIRLELDRNEEFVSGSVSRAYLIRLPLDDQDQIDELAIDLMPHRATFRRHWSSEPDERGPVVRNEKGWRLQSSRASRTLSIGARAVHLGQRLSVEDENGKTLPFRVASIR